MNNHTRRRFVTGCSAAVIAGLAGCSSSDDDDESTAEASTEDSTNNGSTDEEEQEQSADKEEQDADEIENREQGSDVLEFQDLEIIEHEETIEEREYGDDQLIISGVVENHDDAKYDSVYVGVRAYNEDGHQLDQYLDTTNDLQGGGTWMFEVKIYDEPAEEIAEWDIGVWGHQW